MFKFIIIFLLKRFMVKCLEFSLVSTLHKKTVSTLEKSITSDLVNTKSFFSSTDYIKFDE